MRMAPCLGAPSECRLDGFPQGQSEVTSGRNLEVELAGGGGSGDPDAGSDGGPFRGGITIVADGLTGQRTEDATGRDDRGVVLDVRFSHARVVRGSNGDGVAVGEPDRAEGEVETGRPADPSRGF